MLSILRIIILIAFVSSHCQSFFIQRSSNCRWVTSSLHTTISKINDHEVEGVIEPISNNILIKVKSIAAQTVGGVILPASAKERPTEGTVVAAGLGKAHPETGVEIPVSVAPGEKVFYGKFDGTELKYNGVDHQLIKDEDILVKYSGDEASIENLECVRDRILIELPPKEDKAASGLIITTADSKEKGRNTGTIVKMGPGKVCSTGALIPVDLSIGDKVTFSYGYHNELRLNSKDYLVVGVYDILAKW